MESERNAVALIAIVPVDALLLSLGTKLCSVLVYLVQFTTSNVITVILLVTCSTSFNNTVQ